MGKDKLKRPKKWTDWHKDTEFWEKEVRVLFEVTRDAVGGF